MSGDAFLTEPAAGVGRAAPASAQALLLDQEFDSGTLYALRAAVQAHAGQARLSEDRVGEVVLAIHELAANAIAHGAGHGRLRMWERAGALSCEIVDAGPAGAGRRPDLLPAARAVRPDLLPAARAVRPDLLPAARAVRPDLPKRRTRGRLRTATVCGWCGKWPTNWTCGPALAVPGP